MDTDPAPPETVRDYFVHELRRRRRLAGLSQADLARQMNYSPALIGMVETHQRPPTHEFLAVCDRVLGCDGALLGLWPLLAHDVHPHWFRSFVALEAEAVALNEFEVLAIPGLLQTEDYARANLVVGWPPKPAAEIETSIAARLQRQQILERDDPPLLWFVIDESVLFRPFGSRQIMVDQLWHLVRATERPFIRLSVLPMASSSHIGVDGAFALMELPRQERIAYIEGPAAGQVISDPAAVERCRLAFDAIRGQALSVEESVELIVRTIGERYESP